MKIIGTGSATPALTVTNHDLSAFLNTSDEWIFSRTGITQRQILSHERLEDIALLAAKRAIEQAGLTPLDIDYILCSNVYNAYMTPGLGCIVQAALGADCPGVDINGACAGFLYGLELAQNLLKGGQYRHILLLAAEATTRMVDWNDRSTCVLFGDGAGAVVLTAEGEDARFCMRNTPGSEHLFAHNPPGNSPFAKSTREATPLQMNGQEVYKFAVSAATKDIQALCGEGGLGYEDVSLYLLHQANLRILDAVRMRFQLGRERFPSNIDRYGNTSSASVPLLLDELNRAGKLHRGENMILCAFGAGFTCGTALMKW